MLEMRDVRDLRDATREDRGGLTRRTVLGALSLLGAGPAIALPAPAQERLPWASFRKTPDYPRLVEAVRRMKANPDATSPASWSFWPQIHMHHCPHGQDYFLAWHRGYLHLFETQLRAMTGSATLRVPYWDYFADPRLPEEFTAGSAATNPLWESRRGSDVGKALAYGAFDPEVTDFRRGAVNCFESQVEAFHNNVHNLVGGRMATMLSPHDLLFWVHHANVDRLWTAWAAAGQGRTMPVPGDAYWQGGFDYAEGKALPRSVAASGEGLGYRYGDLRFPHPPRPPALAGAAPRPARPSRPVPAPEPPPPMAMAPPPAAAAPAPIPYRGFWLGQEGRYVTLPLRRAREVADVPDDVTILLDTVSLTEAGAEGGYFYDLYLDLDGEGRARPECRLGSLGPFQVAAAMHASEDGRIRIALPAGEVIRREAQGLDLESLGVLFVRVDAGAQREGDLIAIGAIEFAG